MTVTFGTDRLCRHHNIANTCHDCNPYAVARNTDPQTSKQAAASLSSDAITEGQAQILVILRRHGPLTDVGIFERSRNLSESGARTRRSELVRDGLVESCGTRPLASGRLGTIWRVVR